MPAFCCVVDCGSRGERDNVKFFRIPAVTKLKHREDLNHLSLKRKQAWLSAIKRQDFSEAKQKNARICSRHFVSGHPAALKDSCNPDWIPTLNMGYEKQQILSGAAKMERYNRKEKRLQRIEVAAAAAKQDEVMPSIQPEESDGKCSDCEIQTDLTVDDVAAMFVKLSCVPNVMNLVLSCDTLENDNARTRYYTGFSSFKVLMVLIKEVQCFLTGGQKLALQPKDQILLTLVKLRLNTDYTDLAYRFGISSTSASSYFKNCILIMYDRFKNFVIWPERTVLQKTMPNCFKESFEDKITVIIDCFEIRIETPSNLLAKAQTWSNYKSHQTVKYLVGITPQGSICFISEGWGGRVSDKFLTLHSGFIDKLWAGDVVMADRGFLIKEFVELFNAQVLIPAFRRGKDQLNPVDLENTRAIAHVRIHVERVIGMLRQKFRITFGTLPISLINTGEEPILDKILHVCCSLINIFPAIVPL